MGGAPASPEEARKVTPVWPDGVTNVLSNEASLENSPPPQLMDTATTPGWRAAVVTAANRLLNELLSASTRRMLAPGAMAWAHSTSRAISLIQPLFGPGSWLPPRWSILAKGA